MGVRHILRLFVRMRVTIILALFFLSIIPQHAHAAPNVELLGSGSVRSYSTIQEAVNAATAGDTIRLRGGTYFEHVTIADKTGITIEGAPGEAAVLDGAYEPLTKPNALWTSAGGGVYSAALPYDKMGMELDSYAYAITSGNQSLWTYTVKEHLTDQFFAGSGIFLDSAAQKIFIRLDGNADPNKTGISISSAPAVLYITNSSNLTLKNLQVRNGGEKGIFLRFTLSDVTIDGITMNTLSNGVTVWGTPGKNITVKNSTFNNGWRDDWWYSDAKRILPKAMEYSVIQLSKVDGGDVGYNRMQNSFNGIAVNGSNNRIHHNVITNIPDDVFELDTLTAISNIYIYENVLELVGFSAFSFAPLLGDPNAPVYVYRNKVRVNRLGNNFKAGGLNPKYGDEKVAYGDVFKLGRFDGTVENIKIYQNTFVSKKKIINVNSEPLWKNVELYNNIFVTEQDAIVEASGLKSENVEFNGNLYNGGGALIEDWNGTKGKFTSLEDARKSSGGSAAGWEVGGIQADPKLNVQMEIQSGSPAVNKGVQTPKQKNWPDSVKVTDGLPDIGAYEVGGVAAEPGITPYDPAPLPSAVPNDPALTAPAPSISKTLYVTPTSAVQYTPIIIPFMGVKLGKFHDATQDFLYIVDAIVRILTRSL